MLDNPVRRWLQPAAELVEKIGLNTDDVVVDFGCGPGYYTTEIAKRAKAVVAVDISSEMLKKAQEKTLRAGITNVRFIQSNGREIKLPDDSVDKIVLVTVFHEIGDSGAVLKEFGRLLKPQGKLVIVEVVKKMIFPGAPVQNPEAVTAEVEKKDFKLEQMLPYKGFGIFFYGKTATNQA